MVGVFSGAAYFSGVKNGKALEKERNKGKVGRKTSRVIAWLTAFEGNDSKKHRSEDTE